MKIRVLLLLFPIILNSCSGFYKPAKINSPILEKKGDGHITASVGSGINLNGSYSPINKLVLIGNYHKDNSERKENQNYVGSPDLPNNQIEVGLGVYENTLNENKYIDFIAGIGFGESSTTIDINSYSYRYYTYQTNFKSYFIQTTIASDINKDFIFAGGAKLTYFEFDEIDYPPAYSGLIESSFFTNTQKILLQPFINLRYTPGFVGLNANFGFAISNSDDFFTSRGFDLSIGIHLDMNKLSRYVKSNYKN